MHPTGRHLRPAPGYYYRPWRHAASPRGTKSSVSLDKDGFHVMMDVQQFSPEEITVKHVGNEVVVEGKHEEMPDEHGYISRHFVRRYILPKTVNADALTSNLSSDGVLTVAAPRVQPQDSGNLRQIPISHTGMPAIKTKSAKHPVIEKSRKCT
ncbi:protein lethal(2)essential for life-like [Hetaerina americana]|uniref:protein lethal(2)essential for life-like n=1 Tax=Hetaerina americana TaxID=62018 RepID=UPI003A7F3C4E